AHDGVATANREGVECAPRAGGCLAMDTRMRKWVAVGALGVYAATALSTAWDVSDNRPLSLLSCAFAAVLVAAAGGVVRERMWARLLALGAGFTGLTNAAVFFARWAPGHPSTYDN